MSQELDTRSALDDALALIREAELCTLDDETLASLTSMSDLGTVAQTYDIPIESVADYGVGFESVTDKRTLCGVGMALVQWKFLDGEQGPYVCVWAITKEGRKVRFVDGGTGIFATLVQVTAARIRIGARYAMSCLGVPHGLRVSEYVNKAGQPGITYYLAD